MSCMHFLAALSRYLIESQRLLHRESPSHAKHSRTLDRCDWMLSSGHQTVRAASSQLQRKLRAMLGELVEQAMMPLEVVGAVPEASLREVVEQVTAPLLGCIPDALEAVGIVTAPSEAVVVLPMLSEFRRCRVGVVL
jgi:hypothetical protein